MRCLFLCLSFLIAFAAPAQTTFVIKGIVLHEKTREPIAGASVFISNSTRGTVSKQDGSFELVDVPAGNHDLVISSIGYKTVVFSYTTADLPLKLEVQLQPRPSELAAVIVEPDEANGWENWGDFFIGNFIGSAANAADCKLKNPEALRFKHSKKKNTLTVVADEPLVIENKALGYKIQYQLEEFSYDFNTQFLVFLGYTLFEDLPGKDKQQRRWAANRQTAHNGSIQHFMRSLYHNQLEADGYEVKRMIKQENTEKMRIRAIYKSYIEAERAKGQTAMRLEFGDSTEYYNSVMRKPDRFDIILPALLTADSLLTETAGAEKTFFFDHYLHITYKKEKEEAGYTYSFFQKRAPGFQRSTIHLPALTPLTVDSMGNYSPMLGLISYGYWAWSEKICNMLPLDYKPQ